MATYNQISYGSTGSDVTELQKLLNKNGYSLAEDGIFGSKTLAAVRDYQKKNNLAVDGIVGTNTWGALNKASSTSADTASSSSEEETKAPAFEYKDYQESDTVAQAEAMLQQQLANKPGEYQSQWQSQLNNVINKILNREKFSYDLNGDALYQQYKDQYTTQGKMAMMDTMGQAAALTGGYGNSYAQSVGQQTYQGYLQGLNDKIPELYQLALSKYQMEGDELYNQAALMAQQEEQDYGRYRDQVGDWQTERDYLANRYDAERDYDYSKWADNRDFAYGQYADDRAYAYQEERDKVADEQWQAEFDEAKRQFDLSYSNSSGGSGGSSGGGSSYDADVAAIQQQLVDAGYDIDVDGIWGSQTQKAYEDWQAQSGMDDRYQSNNPLNPGGDNTKTPTDTANTKLFRDSIMTSNEFAKHGNKATVKGKTYTSYKSYIEACLADWTDNDVPYLGTNLTDAEVSFLMDYYGL